MIEIPLYLPIVGEDGQPTVHVETLQVHGNAEIGGWPWAEYLCAVSHNVRIEKALNAFRYVRPSDA